MALLKLDHARFIADFSHKEAQKLTNQQNQFELFVLLRG
jgi:hypothetical protein